MSSDAVGNMRDPNPSARTKLESRGLACLQAFSSGAWLQRANLRMMQELVSWIPFGDHPLKLERYRED